MQSGFIDVSSDAIVWISYTTWLCDRTGSGKLTKYSTNKDNGDKK
jgi:hypothetical protein